MASGKQPDWLPTDWVEVKEKSGGKVKYYRNIETGQRFFSKEDVLRYINSGSISNSPPQPVDGDNELLEDTKTVLVKSIKIPEWLPRGWTVELRSRDSGPLIKCYIHPETGRRFYSKPQVSRYLETVNSSPATQEGPNVGCEIGEKSSQEPDATQRDGIPEWLPQGWTMEMKVRGSGISEGKKYKCYIAPQSGRKFFSKQEVSKYLKTLNSSPAGQEKVQQRVDKLSGDTCSSQPDASENCKSIGIKRSISQLKKADVKSPSSKNNKVIERGEVDGLPPGWIREIRTRKSGDQLKKDPYFIDPSSGYEFRSKLDVLRYLETGNMENCAIRPQRGFVNDADSINDTESVKPQIGVVNDTDSINDTEPIRPQRGVVNETICVNDMKSIDKDIVVISRASVEGLPPGWIKESRSRKSASGRRDPYYIDPVSGYEFRSIPDALRYLKTGDIKTCAIKPKRRDNKVTESINKDNEPLSAADKQELVPSPIGRELFPGGLAAPESESSKGRQDNGVSADAIVVSENCPNGTAAEKHSKPGGGSDLAAKGSSAENGSVSTAATDILQQEHLLASGTSENSGEQTGTRLNKSKNRTATPLPPGRSSKRLKGVEPEMKGDPLFNERAIRSAVRGMPKQLEAEPESETNKGEGPADDLAVQEGRESGDQPNGEKTEGKESELLFPFGDSSGLDPCLEFAVKTLTGAIPVEDNLVTHGVSQQP